MKLIIYVKNCITKTDIIVISIILLSAIFTFMLNLKTNSKIDIIITHNNQVYATLPLMSDNTILLEDIAIIEINNNKARISFSTCKNQLCIKQGWSDRLPIICVPNMILIDFKDNNNDKDRMFITY